MSRYRQFLTFFIFGVFCFFSVNVFPDEKQAEPSLETVQVIYTVKESEQSEAQLKIFNDPTLARHFMEAETLPELYRAAERFMEIVRVVDRLYVDTFFPVIIAFMDAVERIETRFSGCGMAAVLEDERSRPEIEKKFEPLKQAFLSYFAPDLVKIYLAEQEVFYSGDLLRRMIAGNHLTPEMEEAIAGKIVEVYGSKGEPVNGFLMRNVVRPVLDKRKMMIMGTADSAVDLVSLREKALPGRVKERPYREAEKLTVRSLRGMARRGR